MLSPQPHLAGWYESSFAVDYHKSILVSSCRQVCSPFGFCISVLFIQGTPINDLIMFLYVSQSWMLDRIAVELTTICASRVPRVRVISAVSVCLLSFYLPVYFYQRFCFCSSVCSSFPIVIPSLPISVFVCACLCIQAQTLVGLGFSWLQLRGAGKARQTNCFTLINLPTVQQESTTERVAPLLHKTFVLPMLYV